MTHPRHLPLSTGLRAWVLVWVAWWTALVSPWVHAGHGAATPPSLMAICGSATPQGALEAMDPVHTVSLFQSDHCRFCLQSTDPQLPPPAPPIATSRVWRGRTALPVQQAFFLPTVAYANAAPRGPPPIDFTSA